MSESADIIVQAHDEASEKLAEISRNLDEFGMQAQTSGKAISAFNTILGSSPLGQFSAQLASTTSKLLEARKAFEAMNKASMLAKGGIILLAIALTAKLGLVIRDAINHFSGLNAEIDKLLKKQAELDKSGARQANYAHAEQLKDFEGIQDPKERLAAQQEYMATLEQEVKLAKSGLEFSEKKLSNQNRWYRADVTKRDVKMLEAAVASDKQRLEIAEEHLFQLQAMTSAREQERQAEERALQAAKERRDMRRAWMEEEKAHYEEMQKREQAAADIQSRNAAMAADLNAKQAADELQYAQDLQKERKRLAQEEVDREVASFEHWAKVRDEANARKKARQDEFEKFAQEVRNRRAQPTGPLQAQESRMLTRNQNDPFAKMKQGQDLTNKELGEIRKLMKQSVEEERRRKREFERFETLGR